MTTWRAGIIALAAAVAGAGLAVGLAAAVTRGSSAPASAAPTAPVQGATPPYEYYRTMMSGYGGSMMGGSYGWMIGQSGYQWMVGGAQAPGWMTGGAVPGFMMGASSDPGQAVGRFWGDAPGPRVDAATAQRLAAAVPPGASVDAATNRVSFSGRRVRIEVVASPEMARDTFEVAGQIDPTIAVPAGASVTVELINADTSSAHGIVVGATSAQTTLMPMMSGPPAFSGAALWFLGDATGAGMHKGSTTFTVSAPGTYSYFCPVPGHAQRGMTGQFVVERGDSASRGNGG